MMSTALQTPSKYPGVTSSNIIVSIKCRIGIGKEFNYDFFSEFIIDFSNEMPFFYGLFTIMFAIILGVAAAFIRKFVSNLKIKLLIKAK